MAGPFYVDAGNSSGCDKEATFSTLRYDDLGAAEGNYKLYDNAAGGTAFSDVEVGYRIRITAGTNLTPGIYQVATVDAGDDYVTLTTSAGSDSTDDSGVVTGNDGLSEANSFLTLCKLADKIQAGETAYVKSGTSYSTQDGATSSIMDLTTAGTRASPIHLIGYTTTITDGGQVTVDAGSSFGACVSTIVGANYYRFDNFIFQNATARGFGDSSVAGHFVFNNCQFTNNGSDGILADDTIIFFKCTFDNNSVDGADVDYECLFIGCKFHTNSGDGVACFGGTFAYCLWYANTGSNCINSTGFGNTNLVVIGCVFDGDGDTGLTGILVNTDMVIAVNNVLYDLNVGADGDTANAANLIISDYNDWNTFNTAARQNNWPAAGANEITDAPDFVDAAGRDYTPGTSSALLAAGFDAGDL